MLGFTSLILRYLKMAKNKRDLNYFSDRCLVTLQSIYFGLLCLVRRPSSAKDESPVARFLKNKYDLDKSSNKPTIKAFLPPPSLETSVYCVAGLQDAAIWRLGRLWTVVNRFGKKSGTSSIKGRAEISVGAIRSIRSLKVECVPSPHPRHHDILGWSDDETDREAAALELVVKSELVLSK